MFNVLFSFLIYFVDLVGFETVARVLLLAIVLFFVGHLVLWNANALLHCTISLQAPIVLSRACSNSCVIVNSRWFRL